MPCATSSSVWAARQTASPREDGFQITVASEVMAILCLAADLPDLKKRLGNILVAYTYAGEPVYCRGSQG